MAANPIRLPIEEFHAHLGLLKEELRESTL